MVHGLHERRANGRLPVRGLSCDESGVFLGGDCPLVTPIETDGRRVYRARALGEINKTLSSDYAAPIDFAKFMPVLNRLAMLLTEGKLGLAQVVAVQTGWPELPEDAAVERSLKDDHLARFNPNHYSAGPRGGRFAPRGDGRTSPGVVVTLPNKQHLVDPLLPSGRLMSPMADLSPVARAGRTVGSIYRRMLSDPQSAGGATSYLYGEILLNVATGGRFDYQRSGSFVTGFIQHRQFRNVSNFNVGLFMQQTGEFSLKDTLDISGGFAHWMSSNARPDKPNGLDPRTSDWIKRGYMIGASGAYANALNQ